jgi:predicted nucleotidyltransferase
VIPNAEALWEVHQTLEALGIPYAIIGGLAVQYWGEARFTKDIDLTMVVPVEEQEARLEALALRLPPRMPDALAFAQSNRIYLAQTKSGMPVDLSLGLPGYEEEVVRRAVDYEIGANRSVKLCSAEDLIVHKAVAGRPQDLYDIEGIVIRQRDRLDQDYLRRWLQIFAEWLESDEVIDHFEKPWKRHASAK